MGGARYYWTACKKARKISKIEQQKRTARTSRENSNYSKIGTARIAREEQQARFQQARRQLDHKVCSILSLFVASLMTPSISLLKASPFSWEYKQEDRKYF